MISNLWMIQTLRIDIGLSDKIKKVIVDSLHKDMFPNLGLNDETLDMIQDQFKKFTEEEIMPHANEWHLKDDLIPNETLKKNGRTWSL